MRRTESGTGRAGRAVAGFGVSGLCAAALVLPGAGVAAAALPANCTATAGTVTCSYGFTGGEQTFAVPAGVTSVQVVAVGARGGRGDGGTVGGSPVEGKGARVTADLPVTAGSVLYVEVGGTGRPGASSSECWPGVECLGGFNGGAGSYFGGGGGGASDVRTVAREQGGTLGSRLLVAAGGGGSGRDGSCPGLPRTAGGDADTAGASGQGCTVDGGGAVVGGTGGGAGTASAGGAGGTPGGSVGIVGLGGFGGRSPGASTDGGAGGGGVYGGGGGGGSQFATPYSSSAGGGGGGSSLVPAGGSREVTSDPAGVTISYSLPDATAPVVAPTVSGTLGGDGWFTSDVEVTWSVTEPDSPVTSTSGCDPASVTSDTAEVTFSCTATSTGGTATNSVTVKRDATAPTLTITGGPDDGSSHAFGSVPAAPTCTATDALSGPPSPACEVTGYAAAGGPQTVTVTATDVAGNTATATRSYTVTPWRLAGFAAPVDGGGVVNVVKGGSTVPLRFEVFAGEVELTEPAAIGAVVTTRASSCTGGTSEEVEFVTTGETSLRYDAAAGQFVQNWKTPRQAGSCYTVTVITADGSALSALFRLS